MLKGGDAAGVEPGLDGRRQPFRMADEQPAAGGELLREPVPQPVLPMWKVVGIVECCSRVLAASFTPLRFLIALPTTRSPFKNWLLFLSTERLRFVSVEPVEEL